MIRIGKRPASSKAISGYMQMAAISFLSVINLSKRPIPSELLSMKAISDIGRQSASFLDGPWKQSALSLTKGIFTSAVTSSFPLYGFCTGTSARSTVPFRILPKVFSRMGSAFSG